MTKLVKKSIAQMIFVMILVFVLFSFRGWFFGTNLFRGFSYSLQIAVEYILWLDILIPIYLLMRRDKESLNDLGFTKEKLPIQVLIGVLIGLITSFGLSGTVSLLGQRLYLFGEVESVGYIPQAGILALRFFKTIILTGLVEEIIFRGYLYKKMLDIKNAKWLAIAVTSVLFGLMHIINGPYLAGIISPMVFGVIYAICRAYLKNCSLTTLILAHGIHNVLNGAIVFGIMDLF